ncbi:MAG: arylesterase [Acidiferrobacterales bacterium]|nr:arylesterase [Acidiferrobacterales bacterium]
MVRLLLSLTLWVLTAQTSAEQPSLVVLGDSLSAGYGINADDSWVHLLQQRLHQQGYPYRVVNASISGDTTRGGLTRVPQALARHAPQILLVQLGGNDGLRGLPLDDMRNNLGAIIEKSRENGMTVLLIGVRLPPNYGEVYIKKFHAVYREVAQRYQVPLVPYLLDGVGGQDQLMQADGLHPNRDAQARMLDNVWPHLLPLLQRK